MIFFEIAKLVLMLGSILMYGLILQINYTFIFIKIEFFRRRILTTLPCSLKSLNGNLWPKRKKPKFQVCEVFLSLSPDYFPFVRPCSSPCHLDPSAVSKS